MLGRKVTVESVRDPSKNQPTPQKKKLQEIIEDHNDDNDHDDGDTSFTETQSE